MMHVVDRMNRGYYDLFQQSGLLHFLDVYCYSDYSGRGWFKTEHPQWSNYKHYRLVPKEGNNKQVWEQFLKDPSKVLLSYNNFHWFSLEGAIDPIEAPSFVNMVNYKIKEEETS